jgi:translation initiation factor 3 subunit M
MPGPSTTLLIEGTFEELADELAQYIDNLKNSHSEGGSNVQKEVAEELEAGKKDEVLKKLIMGSAVLNQAPEKGMFIYTWQGKEVYVTDDTRAQSS